MAEQLANLSKSKDEVQVFEFDISNFSITTAWGSIYGDLKICNTGIDLRNKKIFYSWVGNSASTVWIGCTQIQSDNTSIQFSLLRATAATGISGKIYIMVSD